MKISKEIKWLLPFLHSIQDVYPRTKKIVSIRTIRSSTTKRNRMCGECNFFEDGTFSIKLRTNRQDINFYPIKVSIKPESKIDILCTFAHEIAHIYHYYHTPEHKILECQILSLFMFKLKAQGYISEEEELK